MVQVDRAIAIHPSIPLTLKRAAPDHIRPDTKDGSAKCVLRPTRPPEMDHGDQWPQLRKPNKSAEIGNSGVTAAKPVFGTPE